MAEGNLTVLNYADVLKGVCHRLKKTNFKVLSSSVHNGGNSYCNFIMYGWAYTFHSLKAKDSIDVLGVCKELLLLEGVMSVLNRRVEGMHDVRTGRHLENIARLRKSINSFIEVDCWESFIRQIPSESISELDYTSEQLDRYYGRPQLDSRLWKGMANTTHTFDTAELKDDETSAVNHAKSVFTETEKNRPVFGEHAIRVGQSRMNAVYGHFSQETRTNRKGLDTLWKFIEAFNQVMTFVRNTGSLVKAVSPLLLP